MHAPSPSPFCQVRVLLVELEEARGNHVIQEDDVSSANISSTSEVISQHLVTFRSVEELQKQNQRLLLALRELSDAQEKEEFEATGNKYVCVCAHQFCFCQYFPHSFKFCPTFCGHKSSFGGTLTSGLIRMNCVRGGELEQCLEKAQAELESLKEQRNQHLKMTESIVRQRDMYRVFLAQATGVSFPQGNPDNSQTW